MEILKENIKTYEDLSLQLNCIILNNEIAVAAEEHGMELILMNGSDMWYLSEAGNELTKEEWEEVSGGDSGYVEFEQTYIVNKDAASFLEQNTEEVLYYFPDLDLYLWAVSHFGTRWDLVPFSNWKE